MADRRPSANELERFLLGTLPPPDAARVSEWVASAPEAAETLRALAAVDTFTDALRVVTRADRAQLSTSSPSPVRTVTQAQAPATSSPVTIAFPPAELGGFRIVRELGRGGMGAVFEATDSALGRKVALKVMLPEVAAHPHARARFLREARAAARVEHETIVPIYQVGEADGMPYITMPLLSGESLDVRLKAKTPLPLADIFLIGRQVAEGLAAAHAGGMIHRDIKPSNIWLDVTANAAVRRVRILDFGLARAPGDAVLTGAGDILGTPAYMSVEQARGQLVDFRTDLYSLGVVLYQVATGRRPFDGATAYAVLAALAVSNPPAPAQVNPTIPAALSALIVKLMSKTPAGRPQSARAVVDELARIAAPWKTAASPVTAPKSSHALPAVPPAAPPPARPTPVPPPLPVKPPPLPATDTLAVPAEPLPLPEPEPLPLPDAAFSVEADVTELFHSEPQAEPAAVTTVAPARPRRRFLIMIAVAVGAALVAVVFAFPSKPVPPPIPDKGEPPPPIDPGQPPPKPPKKPELEPVVIPPAKLLPEGDKGLPSDPNRQLGEWLYARGNYQSIWVWTAGGWAGRSLLPSEVRPGGRWFTVSAQPAFDDKHPVTDADLVRFAHPSIQLTRIDLYSPGVTDEVLDKFTRMTFMTKLGAISLHGTAVTDDGLRYLTRHQKIGHISISQSPVTADGIAALAEGMPGTCVINWDKVKKKKP